MSIQSFLDVVCSDSIGPVLIWWGENRYANNGLTQEECLYDLPQNAGELIGRIVNVDGLTKLNGIFRYDPFLNDPEKPFATSDGFDQVLTYYQLNESIRRINGILSRSGRDSVGQILGTIVNAHVNGTEDENAWFSFDSFDLTFGTSKGKFHFASDADVVVHEFGHMFFYATNKKIGSSWNDIEGGAIHEAFGDLLSALIFDDPEMAEAAGAYFYPNNSQGEGIRKVNNNSILKGNSSKEPHKRSLPYSGMFWDVKKALEEKFGKNAAINDLLLLILTQHGYHYSKVPPNSQDFPKALINALRSLSDAGQLDIFRSFLPIDSQYGTTEAFAKDVESLIVKFSKERGLIKAAEEEAYVLEKLVEAKGVTGVNPDKISYKEIKTSPLSGGISTSYQQYYGNYLVVGGTFVINKIGSHTYTHDLSVKISKTINEVVSLNVEDAWNKLKTSHVSLLSQIKQLQKNGLISERDADTLMKDITNNINRASYRNSKLVVLEGKTNLQYEFAFGMVRCYVDAVTGDLSLLPGGFI